MNLPSLVPQEAVPAPVAPLNAPEHSHAGQAKTNPRSFVDRRSSARTGTDQSPAHGPPSGQHTERRQFGSSHAGLSPAGRELAAAIDRYKLQFRRRYITCDEMLLVLRELGYERGSDTPADSAAEV